MAYLCNEDSKKVAYIYLEKQYNHQYSGLLDPTWKMSLIILIFLMMIRNLGVTSKWLPYVMRTPKR